MEKLTTEKYIDFQKTLYRKNIMRNISSIITEIDYINCIVQVSIKNNYTKQILIYHLYSH